MNMQNKWTMAVVLMVAGMLSLAGCEKKAETTPEPGASEPATKTTAGTEIDDSAITTKVKSALLADDIVKGLDIQVETSKGEVQLSGFVDSQDQIDRAVTIAKAEADYRVAKEKCDDSAGNAKDVCLKEAKAAEAAAKAEAKKGETGTSE